MEVYSLREIAAAAGVPVGHVERHVISGDVPTSDGFVPEREAIRLVRAIGLAEPAPNRSPAFFAVTKSRERRGLSGLVTSGVLHAVIAGIVIVSSLTLVSADDERDEPPPAMRLVYLNLPGPGGGGGGGGIRSPLPVRRAERKAPVIKKISSPVPEVKPPTPPPAPKPDPPPVPPPPVVQAPVVPKPADPVEAKGIPAPVPEPPAASQGSGSNGGTGTGAGQGIGEGTGPGIGPGSGGGEGGGPYRPGSGIEPPSLVREVKANYTDEARRRGIEGEVVLEIVVRRDGSVGDVQVRRGLDRGLDARAIDAVRQWRFSPAKRRGVAVDVIVEVAVEFALR